MDELKHFAIKIGTILIMAPLAGWLFLRLTEKCEAAWKSGNRRRRWGILSGVFILLASIGGWLR